MRDVTAEHIATADNSDDDRHLDLVQSMHDYAAPSRNAADTSQREEVVPAGTYGTQEVSEVHDDCSDDYADQWQALWDEHYQETYWYFYNQYYLQQREDDVHVCADNDDACADGAAVTVESPQDNNQSEETQPHVVNSERDAMADQSTTSQATDIDDVTKRLTVVNVSDHTAPVHDTCMDDALKEHAMGPNIEKSNQCNVLMHDSLKPELQHADTSETRHDVSDVGKSKDAAKAASITNGADEKTRKPRNRSKYFSGMAYTLELLRDVTPDDADEQSETRGSNTAAAVAATQTHDTAAVTTAGSDAENLLKAGTEPDQCPGQGHAEPEDGGGKKRKQRQNTSSKQGLLTVIKQLNSPT